MWQRLPFFFSFPVPEAWTVSFLWKFKQGSPQECCTWNNASGLRLWGLLGGGGQTGEEGEGLAGGLRVDLFMWRSASHEEVVVGWGGRSDR